MRVSVRTCESGGVFHLFTRVGDTCEVFVSAVARVCVRYSDVLHVCTYTMLDSTTDDRREGIIALGQA